MKQINYKLAVGAISQCTQIKYMYWPKLISLMIILSHSYSVCEQKHFLFTKYG